MAENKKSFTAYCDWNTTFNSLPDDKAGQLIKHLFAYVNDEEPVTDDLLINAVFANIKATLKRDLIKWKEKSEKNKQIAIDRWAKKESESNNINTNVCERIKIDANYTDSVSVSDSVKDIIVVKKESKPSLETRSLAFKESLRPFINKFGVDMVKNFYSYWSEPNQSKTKMLFELQKTWDTSRRLENWSKRESSFNNKQEVKHNNLGI
jgi:hypothetical protein